MAAPALAAAPEPPKVEPPTEVKATTALLHGFLDPLKAGPMATFETVNYEFVYLESGSECEGVGEVKTTQGMSLGAGKEEVSQAIKTLTANSEYTVCLHAEGTISKEAITSPPLTFKTALPPEKPTTTTPAEEIKGTTAKLEGTLNPLKAGEAGTYEFFVQESATECNREHFAPESPGTMTGAKAQAVSATPSNAWNRQGIHLLPARAQRRGGNRSR